MEDTNRSRLKFSSPSSKILQSIFWNIEAIFENNNKDKECLETFSYQGVEERVERTTY